MQRRHLVLVLMLTLTVWLLPSAAQAELKLTTLNVKGMVCQA